jgi:hypothetical protein
MQLLTQDQNSYAHAEEALLRALRKQGADCTWYCDSFNPYPFVIPQSEFAHQKRLQQILFLAINRIVRAYSSDHRLQQLIALPEPAFRLISSLDLETYKIGSYRPDFLHDTAGGTKICEINARFPTNGYFISHYLNESISELDYLSNGIQSIDQLSDVPETFLQRFKPGNKIAILKRREVDWDIRFLKYELTSRGYSFEVLSGAHTKNAVKADGVVIELHQDELLCEEVYSVIEQVGIQKPHFNDLRTIWIAHDKRLLAVFHDDEIMADYLNEEDKSFLQSNVMETHVIGLSPEIVDVALKNRGDWVLKPNLFGKGVGMVFGYSSSIEEWAQLLREPQHQEYVLQRFVNQRKFPIRMSTNEVVSIQQLNVVGTLLCFDDSFLGPGIYRASKEDIVNVAGGGTILFPMLNTD